ncbi:hypothetical protein [Micromonospora radicis]|uniref:Uncharacterized protein n=1 Tax=Micromonospora radicis TaxID=1894971 RepID=A0A418MN66_9ACTN|nr:hypothetical protein [Micromonospora radicis]RIV31675.1 hypothetical protein D2L64_25280 [Micromonospora radicis]
MDIDPGHRLRGALLVGVGVGALALGGWWWQTEAPTPLPAGAQVAAAPDGGTHWPGDPVTGNLFRQDPGAASTLVLDAATGGVLVDPRTGAVLPSVGESVGGASAADRQGVARPGNRGTVVWSDEATLSDGMGVVRLARIGPAEPHLLRFSCTGPGELLITVTGARAADPLTAGCDGAVVTTEIIGTGAPVQVTFTTAGAAPLKLVARLIALP